MKPSTPYRELQRERSTRAAMNACAEVVKYRELHAAADDTLRNHYAHYLQLNEQRVVLIANQLIEANT